MEKMKADCRPVPVIFLDRDGTMNEEVNYLHRPADMRLIPGTAEAIRRFREAGYRVIVVTNQAGVARGYYTEADVEILHTYMNEILGREGAHVDAFYYCPHHPEHGIGKYKRECSCRKPGIGLFLRAEEELGAPVDSAHSFMIGDKLADTQAGHNYGIASVLVGTGYGSEIRRQQEKDGTLFPDGSCADYDYYAEDLAAAADAILSGQMTGRKKR